jgi:hypothetical protein
MDAEEIKNRLTTLVGHFGDAVAPMAEQVLLLQRQIQNLRRARDLLSGQVELSVAEMMT